VREPTATSSTDSWPPVKNDAVNSMGLGMPPLADRHRLQIVVSPAGDRPRGVAPWVAVCAVAIDGAAAFQLNLG
jgi:hypothetical protein